MWRSLPKLPLQTDIINSVTGPQVELERKLESLVKSKQHYKDQWVKVLRELAAVRQKEQVTSISLSRCDATEFDPIPTCAVLYQRTSAQTAAGIGGDESQLLPAGGTQWNS